MPLELFSILLAIAAFGTTIYISWQEDKTKKKLKKEELAQRQKIYQIATLRQIQEQVGYSLDVEKIIDVITGSLKQLFPYSAASSILLTDTGAVFKSYLEENVNAAFVQNVKASMLGSLGALLDKTPAIADERISGVPMDESNTLPLASFFHIPIVLNSRVVGLINVSSTKTGLYKEEEMTILYQIAKQASGALSKLEEILEIEKGKLMSLIGSLTDGVFMIDNANRLVVINDAARRYLKAEKQDITYMEILNLFPAKVNILGWATQALREKKMIFQKDIMLGDRIFEIQIMPTERSFQVSPQGSPQGVPLQRLPQQANRNVEANSSKTGNPPFGVSVVMHDVTLEKSVEQMKEDFTNMIVHELRSPLVSIKDSAELLATDSGLTPQEKTSFLKIINNQSKILLDEVGQILDAAKVENKKFVLNKEKSDLVSVIKKQLDIFIPQFEKKSIALSLQLPKIIPQFIFDSFRISQVINNLVSNSLKFTPAGGTITVAADVDGDVVKASVADTGMGITPEMQKTLFEKYMQAATTPHDLARKGTGLGLYLTKAIILAHGGSIDLESSPGQGTKITFTLPMEGASSHQTSEHESSHPPEHMTN